ncbi:ABC transporter [Spraguea lophii 42_110]|uniref:ABC transporter n=1 Tax=Spraguea lophii (strain 42_110) TaxID=1358809 RepID=S7W545_SPRLO|nr:ABC transporter [Spraguea lophii 42_110]
MLYDRIEISLNGLPQIIILLKSRLVTLDEILKYKMNTKNINIISDNKYDLSPTFNSNILFDNVAVMFYDHVILENIILKIEKGVNVAIIGNNSYGKSSLIKTLSKFYECEGNIYLDSINIKDIGYKRYLHMFSYTSQDLILFNNNIMYNRKYGIASKSYNYDKKYYENFNKGNINGKKYYEIAR